METFAQGPHRGGHSVLRGFDPCRVESMNAAGEADNEVDAYMHTPVNYERLRAIVHSRIEVSAVSVARTKRGFENVHPGLQVPERQWRIGLSGQNIDRLPVG